MKRRVLFAFAAAVGLAAGPCAPAARAQVPVPAASQLPPQPVIPPGPPPPRPPRQDETFALGDGLFAPHAGAFDGRFATEFTLLDQPFIAEARGTAFASGALAAAAGREDESEFRLGAEVAPTRLYAGLGFLRLSGEGGFPARTGLGAGLAKAPDLDQRSSLYADVWYYPHVAGGALAQAALLYRAGGTVLLGGPDGRVFLDAGYRAEQRRAKTPAASSDALARGPYAGLGIRF